MSFVKPFGSGLYTEPLYNNLQQWAPTSCNSVATGITSVHVL